MSRSRKAETATKWELRDLRALDSAVDPYLHAMAVEELFTGLRKLQLAVLEDACRVIERGGYSDDPQLFERDVLWVTGQTPSEPNFSFEDICASLKYNPAAWRERLLEIAEESRKRRAPRAGHSRQSVRPRVAAKRMKAA